MLDSKTLIEMIQGVDKHLSKNTEIGDLLREIKATLKEMLHFHERKQDWEMAKMRKQIEDITFELRKRGLPEVSKYESDFREVRELLNDNEWPLAVPIENICDSPEKIKKRAETILDLFVGEHLRKKRYLDFGCGTGHTIPLAIVREAEFALGYDVDLSKVDCPAEMVTSDFEHVKKNAPYDIVVLYDVLDHIVLMDPVAALLQIKNLISKTGKLYIRNHPWSSRHGGHLYLNKNKAFLHLIMDEIELTRTNGLQCEHNIRVVTPLETYRSWFNAAGFQVISEFPIKTKVEDYFLKPSLINERLKMHWTEPDQINRQLEISFVDYVVQPIHLNHEII